MIIWSIWIKAGKRVVVRRMSARSVTRSPLHPVGREQIAQCIFHIPFATSRAGSGPMCTRVGGLEISFFSCTLQEVPVCPLTLPRTAQVPLLLVTTVNCVPLCVCVRHHKLLSQFLQAWCISPSLRIRTTCQEDYRQTKSNPSHMWPLVLQVTC